MTDDLQRSLDDIVRALETCGIEHMLVGSLAALAHGRARTTHDFGSLVLVAMHDERVVA